MNIWTPKITLEFQLEDNVKAIKARGKGIKIIVQWDQSPSKDVIQYRLYAETGESIPSYNSPYCTIAKPPGNRSTIKYSLSECHLFFGFSGRACIAIAAVDHCGNISDLTEPVHLII
jgi:hypothetical protein